MQPNGKLSAWLVEGLERHKRVRNERGQTATEPEVGQEVSGEREIAPSSTPAVVPPSAPRSAPPSDRSPPSRLPPGYVRSRSSGARVLLGLVANPYWKQS